MMAKENPFTTVNRLFTEKNVPIDNGYLVNRILSFQPETLFLSTELNKYSTGLPDWATMPLFNLRIKKRKRQPYLQYIKKEKEKDVILSKKISQIFCCNKFHTKQIIDILQKMGKRPEEYFGLKKGD